MYTHIICQYRTRQLTTHSVMRMNAQCWNWHAHIYRYAVYVFTMLLMLIMTMMPMMTMLIRVEAVCLQEAQGAK